MRGQTRGLIRLASELPVVVSPCSMFAMYFSLNLTGRRLPADLGPQLCHASAPAPRGNGRMPDTDDKLNARGRIYIKPPNTETPRERGSKLHEISSPHPRHPTSSINQKFYLTRIAMTDELLSYIIQDLEDYANNAEDEPGENPRYSHFYFILEISVH